MIPRMAVPARTGEPVGSAHARAEITFEDFFHWRESKNLYARYMPGLRPNSVKTRASMAQYTLSSQDI